MTSLSNGVPGLGGVSVRFREYHSKFCFKYRKKNHLVLYLWLLENQRVLQIRSFESMLGNAYPCCYVDCWSRCYKTKTDKNCGEMYSDFRNDSKQRLAPDTYIPLLIEALPLLFYTGFESGGDVIAQFVEGLVLRRGQTAVILWRLRTRVGFEVAALGAAHC